MEQPYKGRAIIRDNFIDIQITIPAKRNWFIILFIGAWLGGWLFGEVFAIGAVTRLLGGNAGGLFILFWLIAWTVGGFLAIRTFLWNLMGMEKITVGQGRLRIVKIGALFFKPKIYDLNEVKNIRVQDDSSDDRSFWGGRQNSFAATNLGGTIRFDYGLQTVKFAIGLDEAEARFILQQLKDRHLLSEKNYN